ncbi:MAG: archease [Euryarchaeota archaeon]|nr:archease [Euryarchaeota archaeon]
MPYRLFDFSSDQGIEGEGPDLGTALVELARAVAHVVTDGSKIRPTVTKPIDIRASTDVVGTAVAFANEVVYLFDVEQFLAADGTLHAVPDKQGVLRVQGHLRGETFDAARHGSGRGVKAATYHDATYRSDGGTHRIRLVLDL